MNTVVQVQPMQDHHLKLTFADGYTGIVDVRPLIGKGFTKELLDMEQFKLVATEPGGGIAWSNGFDLCPEFLRDLVQKKNAA